MLDAPFVPLEPHVIETVFKLAEIKPGEIFYELGCGDGRLVIQAALHGAKAYGVEINNWRYLVSRFWTYFFRVNKSAIILKKNIFDVDYSKADIIFLYLLQETNEKLQPKLERELKPGARVISAAFTFPGWVPKKIHPRGPIYGPLYLYVR